MPKVILESSDKRNFPVEVEIAKMSTTIKTMLDDLGVNSEEGKEEKIPLPNVQGDILKLVIQWAEQHQGDPPLPDTSERRTDDISQWDQTFLQVEGGVLFDLILAAKYLDIQGLFHVTCTTVANMIKGKTPEEIRRAFNIRNDFTQAEEDQIRKENERLKRNRQFIPNTRLM